MNLLSTVSHSIEIFFMVEHVIELFELSIKYQFCITI